MFKIIMTDNLARETVAEKHVLELSSEPAAQQICDILNNDNSRGDAWYVVKPRDYTLWRGMEEFV